MRFFYDDNIYGNNDVHTQTLMINSQQNYQN